MLDTPLGKIHVTWDGKPIEHRIEKAPLYEACKDLDGRYFIHISFEPDGKEHNIDCKLVDFSPIETEPSSGERVESLEIYEKEIKMSIATQAEILLRDRNGNIEDDPCNIYNYDVEYLETGMRYIILPITTEKEVIFGVSWMSNYDDDNEVQTWFGAQI